MAGPSVCVKYIITLTSVKCYVGSFIDFLCPDASKAPAFWRGCDYVFRDPLSSQSERARKRARAGPDSTQIHPTPAKVRTENPLESYRLSSGFRVAWTLKRQELYLATAPPGSPPAAAREIELHDVYVTADGSALARVAELAASGNLDLQVGALFPIDQAAEALTLASSGHAGGAVALTFDQ